MPCDTISVDFCRNAKYRTFQTRLILSHDIFVVPSGESYRFAATTRQNSNAIFKFTNQRQYFCHVTTKMAAPYVISQFPEYFVEVCDWPDCRYDKNAWKSHAIFSNFSAGKQNRVLPQRCAAGIGDLWKSSGRPWKLFETFSSLA